MRTIVSSLALGTALLALGTFARAAEPAAPAPASPAPAAGQKTAPEGPVARVNGVAIARADFERTWQLFLRRSGIPTSHADKSGKVDEFRKQVLDRLVDEELLYQDAKGRNLLADPKRVEAEVEKARAQFPTPEAYTEALQKSGLTEESLRALFARNMSVQGFVEQHIGGAVAVSDAEVHDFYSGNPEAFKTAEKARARHILVQVNEADNPAVKAEKRAKAEGLLKQLKEGADFGELAQKSSDCPSAAKGGDLGFFERGQMVKPFEDAAFALAPGELSGVVETQFGFHVIRLEEKSAAGTVAEQEAGPRIREFLKERKTEEAVQARLKALREKAAIELLLKL